MFGKTLAVVPILLVALCLGGSFPPALGQPDIIMPKGDTAAPVVQAYGILAWLEGNIWSVAVAPNGKQVAVTFDSRNPLGLYDPINGKELFRLQKPYEHIRGVAFAPDGKTLATGGHKLDKTSVRIWDAVTHKVMHELPYFLSGCQKLAYSPDSKMLGTIEGIDHLCLWEVKTGKMVVALRQEKGDVLVHFAFSPDGKTLATATRCGMIELRDLSGPAPLVEAVKKKPVVTIDIQAQSNVVITLVHVGFTPDGQTLVTACPDNTVQFWDPKTGKLKKKLAVPVVWEKERVDKLKGNDKKNYQTSWFIKFTSIQSLAFSPDGTILVVGNGSFAYFIDIRSNILFAKSVPCGQIKEIAFAPDGSYLVTSSGSGAYVFKTPKKE